MKRAISIGLFGCLLAAPAQAAAPASAETGERLERRLNSSLPLRLRKHAETRVSCECVNVVGQGDSWIDLEVVPDAPGSYRYEVEVLTGETVHETVSFDLDVTGPKLLERDASLYCDAGVVVPKADAYTLIDMRRASQYAASKIPGALQLRPHAIRAKSFLRGRKLVLVDAGHGDMGTEALCRRLRDDGFVSVQILHGGVVAWRRAGGSIERLAGSGAQDELSARTLLTARAYTDWVLVNAERDSSRRAAVQAALPQAEALDLAEGEDWIDALRDRVLNEGQPVRVLLVDRDGSQIAQMRDALGAGSPAPVFFLAGGAEAYAAAKASQAHAKQGSSSVSHAGRDPLGLYRRACSRCPK